MFTRGACRSPYGERGLKCQKIGVVVLEPIVALLTESVDRNQWDEMLETTNSVALLTESVD